jgi:hypothetical protein
MHQLLQWVLLPSPAGPVRPPSARGNARYGSTSTTTHLFSTCCTRQAKRSCPGAPSHGSHQRNTP